MHHRTSFSAHVFALFLAAACSGGGDDSAGNIGPSGGTVSDPSGAEVVVPPGALAQSTPIAVAQSNAGAPAMPNGVTAFGPLFAFTPHGTTFAMPVTITVPFNPSSVPAGSTPVLYKTNQAMTAWNPVPGAHVEGGKMVGQVTGFSFVGVAADPGLVEKTWSYQNEYRVGNDEPFGDSQSGGELDVLDRVGHDPPIAASDWNETTPNAEVFSNDAGQSFFTATVAPHFFPDDPKQYDGTKADLTQTFTFRATEDSPPRLSVVVNGAHFALIDDGGNAPNSDICPWWVPLAPPDLLDDACFESMSSATNELVVRAESQRDGGQFYGIGGIAEINGQHDRWTTSVLGAGEEHRLWTTADFVEDVEAHTVSMDLLAPITIAVPVQHFQKDDVFQVTVVLHSSAHNDLQGETFTEASLRNPVGGSGVEVSFDGLELIPARDDIPVTVPPLSCATGTTPAAGILQFSAAEFRAPEGRGEAAIVIERVGGTQGLVSVQLATSDGTAMAGSDYRAVQTVIRFADGEDGTRVVKVPLVIDDVLEPEETVQLTLSNPGGCAALGDQATAALTILDDDRPPTTSQTYTVGGTVSGLAGTGLALREVKAGGDLTPGSGAFTFTTHYSAGAPYEVRVVSQPVNPIQVCTIANGSGTVGSANVTSVAVSCVTTSQNPALDPSFGSGGTLVAARSFAQAMALQPDGKIVAVGKMMLSRYQADGSVDTSFGSGGNVTIVANGGPLDAMQGVALQADGKIVVAGVTSLPTSFNDDIVVIRYDAAGQLDPTFGTGGKVITDVHGLTDRAYAVAVQPDGKIVIAGMVTSGTLSHGDVDFGAVRYLSDGSLDGGFGSGGVATVDIAGVSDRAHGLALAADGSIVVVGRASPPGGPADAVMGVARFLADGTPDGGFGSGGAAIVDIGGQDSEAQDVVALADGKVLIGGFARMAGKYGYALARLDNAGKLDSTFGTGGVATNNFSGSDDFGQALALSADGKIWLGGGVGSDFGVVRYAGDGTLDASFGSGGLVTVDFFGAFDEAFDLIVQGDGKVLVGGTAVDGGFSELGIARLLP